MSVCSMLKVQQTIGFGNYSAMLEYGYCSVLLPSIVRIESC